VTEDAEDTAERLSAGQPGVLDLLDQLYDGPAGNGPARARELLLDRTDPPPASERATAREEMPVRGWYVPALSRDDPWDIDPVLEAIFRLTVVPDLDSPAVTRTLAQWALSCPTEVIRALSAAAARQRADQAEQHLTEQHLAEALAPALAQRWLTDHGIHAVLAQGIRIGSPAASGTALNGPARSAGEQPHRHARADGRRARWLLVPDNHPNAGVLASMLAWMCLMLFAIVVLSSWHV
jgi:hypothetical protein